MERLRRAFLERDEEEADALLLALWEDVSARYPDAASLWHTREALAAFRPGARGRLQPATRVSAKLFLVAWAMGAPACAERPLVPPGLAVGGADEERRVGSFALSLRAHFDEKYAHGGEPAVERDLQAAAAALREC